MKVTEEICAAMIPFIPFIPVQIFLYPRKSANPFQLERPWAPTDEAVFGDIVYVLEYLHTPGDDRRRYDK